MKFSKQTKQLEQYLPQLLQIFNENRPPERINDQSFFAQVKEETTPIFNLLQEWEKEAVQFLKVHPIKNIFPQQIASAKENMEALILHSYYVDIRRRQYMEIYRSLQYTLTLILSELEKVKEK